MKGLSGEVQCSARAKRRSRKTTPKTNRAVQGEKWEKMRKGSRLLMANMNLKEQVSVFIFLPSYKLAASVPLSLRFTEYTNSQPANSFALNLEF